MEWQLPCKSRHLEERSKVFFQNMTGEEIKERLAKDDIIIIPVGSTEAHGPHATYGFDTWVVVKLAEMVAEKTGCTVAQPIWYGYHPAHHIGMPGTIPVPEDVFIGYLVSVIAGFWNAGFRKQILLNVHGQEHIIPAAIHRFAEKYQVPAILIHLDPWHIPVKELSDKEHGGPFDTPFIHADEVETSVGLAMFPEFVDMSKAVDTCPKGFLGPEHVDKAGNLYQKPINWYGHFGLGPIEVAEFEPGCVGAATKASAEKAMPAVK
ncbi:MAG: 3-dehydro-scyllo-inosose hydrolase, partial [Candidatus Korarchaeota archaeon]